MEKSFGKNKEAALKNGADGGKKVIKERWNILKNVIQLLYFYSICVYVYIRFFACGLF